MPRFKIEQVGNLDQQILEIIREELKHNDKETVEIRKIINRLKSNSDRKLIPRSNSIRMWILKKRDDLEYIKRKTNSNAKVRLKESI